jgi:hypothetical protein
MGNGSHKSLEKLSSDDRRVKKTFSDSHLILKGKTCGFYPKILSCKRSVPGIPNVPLFGCICLSIQLSSRARS